MAGEVATAEATEASRIDQSGPLLDGVVAVLSALMVAGIAWDFRQHAQGISFAEEGFFTLQHVFFYSMFLGIAVVIGAATVANRRRGAQWLDAVPTGYGWGVVGVLIFGFGGLGDLGWHSAFGFEQGIEGLVSPSHLTLAIGATVFLASPLRAAWYRDGDLDGVDVLTVVLSASLALSILALFGAFVNPLPQPVIRPGLAGRATLGVAMLTLFPLLLVGAGLTLARRFDLPPGALTIVFAIPALASSVPFDRGQFAAAAILAGLVADGIVQWRRPVPTDRRAVRVFGAVVPVAFAAGFLGVLFVEYGRFPWTTHIWTGAVALAGLAGLLLSYAVAPPAIPAERSTGGATEPTTPAETDR